jgi:hypothetical protein
MASNAATIRGIRNHLVTRSLREVASVPIVWLPSFETLRPLDIP